jgi:hypothetical protein
MTLWDEIYFEITARGRKADLRKFINFLNSGELDEFFEVEEDYIIYDDAYAGAEDSDETEVIFTNDDYGIETEEFDTDEFLEFICKAGKSLDLYGTLSDADGNEYHFESAKGDSYYVNARGSGAFNDELDEVAYNEEKDADD